MFSNYTIDSVGQFKLFVTGNVDLLNSSVAKSRFAVAGSRRISKSGANWLKNFISQFNQNHIIVSGLALGADSIAHRTALKCGIPQIAVLPSGFNNITPRSNIKLARDIVDNGGCLVSLLPPASGASRSSYIARNEVIAYLGHMLIVPEFNIKSGTRHTVDFARDFGRFIIVNNSQSSGNQFIINSNSYKTITK